MNSLINWFLQKSLLRHVMERLQSRSKDVLDHAHLDLDYFQYVINQEVFIKTSVLTVLDTTMDAM